MASKIEGTSSHPISSPAAYRFASDCNREDGPRGPTVIDRSPFIAEVAKWVTVWQSEEEGAPGTGLCEFSSADVVDRCS